MSVEVSNVPGPPALIDAVNQQIHQRPPRKLVVFEVLYVLCRGESDRAFRARDGLCPRWLRRDVVQNAYTMIDVGAGFEKDGIRVGESQLEADGAGPGSPRLFDVGDGCVAAVGVAPFGRAPGWHW